jgi:peptidoglycan/LPS O-acetylase OafA/YrhL
MHGKMQKNLWSLCVNLPIPIQSAHRTLLILCALAVGAIYGLFATAPLRVPLAVTDSALVTGVWGTDGSGVWSNGQSTIDMQRVPWAPWSMVSFAWLRPPGDPLAVTVQSGGVTLTASPDLAARRVQLLLPQPDVRSALQFTSATRQVAGDRRNLGVFVDDVAVQRLSMPQGALLWAIFGYALPILGAALWLLRGRWFGTVVFVGFAALYLTLLSQEVQSGFAYPSLLLVSPWREGFSLFFVVMALRRPFAKEVVIPRGGRRFGLDFARGTALLIVLVAHFIPLMLPAWSQDRDIFRWFLITGAMAVDTFFTLSGYLIGSILLRSLPRFGQPAILRWYLARRWLRTLPAAYISMAVVWVVAAPKSISDYLWSLFFLGTMNPAQVSEEFGFWWSLGTEELFYLLFPLVLYAAVRILPQKRAFILTLGIFGLVPFVVRLVGGIILPPEVAGNLDYAPYARIDSMLWGIIVAWIRSTRPEWFSWMAVRGVAPGIFVFAIGYMLALDPQRWFMATLLLSHVLATMGSAILLPRLEQITTLGWNLADRAISWAALVSYSAYLYHTMAMHRTHIWFGTSDSWQSMLGLLVFYLTLTFVLAGVSFYAVEMPFLRWRDKHFPEKEA